MSHSNRSDVDLRDAPWRKSSYSGVQSDCLEIADDLPDLTPVRDSKNPHGPALLFETSAWSAFVTGVKTGRIGH
ncbi:DUF397 domain-containing protein [Streptomyces sp. NPDC001678]|uniref:DUF397 domain-containing protein n=1 Tax=Streptomyces sp. NPDC001678 TaxID=3364599 RepID=UPI0036C953B7